MKKLLLAATLSLAFASSLALPAHAGSKSWVAVASRGNQPYTAWGPTQQSAMQNALARCQRSGGGCSVYADSAWRGCRWVIQSATHWDIQRTQNDVEVSCDEFGDYNTCRSTQRCSQ